ncbi:acyl-CoA thioesterase [Flavobacteriaceae bacterium S0862]|nr:acyl-CoA thioesterase [Flavobacteriaceae bacterium S0862]
MQVYEQRIKITKDDLDELNHVNNVRYVQWIQDIAKAHWKKNVTQDIKDSFFWVVVSHFIEYKSPAFLNDQILIKTYVTKPKGVTSTRIVEMYKDNTLLVKAETVWCLLSTSTNRPTRITEEIADLFE